MAKYRYTIILDRFDTEDFGPEATADHGDELIAHHDGSDARAIAQVAKELQEAMDESGLPVGIFDIVKREKVD